MPVVTIHNDLRDTAANREDEHYVKRSTKEKEGLILEELDTFINKFKSLGDLSVAIKQNTANRTDIFIKRSCMKNNEQEGFKVKEDGYQATFSISTEETSEITSSILDAFSDGNIEQATGRKGRDKSEFSLSYPEGKVTISIDANKEYQELIERLYSLTVQSMQKQIKSNKGIQEK